MEKEIRMPYSEYEELITYNEFLKNHLEKLKKIIEDRENVLIFEMDYSHFYGTTAKILKYPSENFEVEEIFKQNFKDKNDIIYRQSCEIQKLKSKKSELESKIPWWRK